MLIYRGNECLACSQITMSSISAGSNLKLVCMTTKVRSSDGSMTLRV